MGPTVGAECSISPKKAKIRKLHSAKPFEQVGVAHILIVIGWSGVSSASGSAPKMEGRTLIEWTMEWRGGKTQIIQAPRELGVPVFLCTERLHKCPVTHW